MKYVDSQNPNPIENGSTLTREQNNIRIKAQTVYFNFEITKKHISNNKKEPDQSLKSNRREIQ